MSRTIDDDDLSVVGILGQTDIYFEIHSSNERSSFVLQGVK